MIKNIGRVRVVVFQLKACDTKRLYNQIIDILKCPSLDFLRNTPKWVSKKDGARLKLRNALHNVSAPQPGKALHLLRGQLANI